MVDTELSIGSRERQPKWTAEELESLHSIFKEWGPYSDGDYSQFYRVVRQQLPHRTLSGALKKIHEAQVSQLVPYYGALPMGNARERDISHQEAISLALADWKKAQADKVKASSKTEAGGLTISRAHEQMLYDILRELTNIRGFLAGIYERASGKDGKYLLVEILQHAALVTQNGYEVTKPQPYDPTLR